MGMTAPEPVNNQKNLLWACFNALAFTELSLGEARKELRQIVIKTDSEWLAQAMTEYMPKWKENGFRNGKGRRLADADTYELVDGLVGSLAASGVQILLWLVPRDQNKEADELAEKALDSADHCQIANPHGVSFVPFHCGLSIC